MYFLKVVRFDISKPGISIYADVFFFHLRINRISRDAMHLFFAVIIGFVVYLRFCTALAYIKTLEFLSSLI